MNNHFAKLVSVGAVFGLSCYVAPAIGQTYPLTFETAIEYALANRIEMKIEKFSLDEASARVDEAKGAFLPTLDMTSSSERVHLYDKSSPIAINATFNNTKMPIVVNRTDMPYQIRTRVQLTYNLYAGNADQSRLKEAVASQKAANAQEALSKKAVVLDVITAFCDLLKMEIAYRKAHRLREFAQEELLIATEQFKQGRLSKIERDVKMLAVESQDIDLRNASKDVRDAQRRYAFALGFNEGHNEFSLSNLHNALPETDFERIFSKAGLASNHQVLRTQADLEAAQAVLQQISSEYKPKLDFFVRFDGIGRSGSNFSDAVKDYGREVTTVGLALKWNLFDGFRSDSRTKQAYASLEKMRLKVHEAVRTSKNNWEDRASREASLKDQLRLAEMQFELSRERLVIVKKRLDSQTASTLQYWQSQLAVGDGLSKVETLKIDLLLAQAKRQLEMFE